MSAGERMSWGTCPRCGLAAAVGRRDGARLIAADLARRGAKELRYRPPISPEPTAGGVVRVAAGPAPSSLRSDR
jgi:hypothetical protein